MMDSGRMEMNMERIDIEAEFDEVLMYMDNLKKEAYFNLHI